MVLDLHPRITALLQPESWHPPVKTGP
jgi:hypothetical protein